MKQFLLNQTAKGSQLLGVKGTTDYPRWIAYMKTRNCKCRLPTLTIHSHIFFKFQTST